MMRLVVLVAAALLLAPAAFASEQHPTLNELENEVMCPVCGTTLAQSDSAAAKQIERQIQIRIKASFGSLAFCVSLMLCSAILTIIAA